MDNEGDHLAKGDLIVKAGGRMSIHRDRSSLFVCKLVRSTPRPSLSSSGLMRRIHWAVAVGSAALNLAFPELICELIC